MSEAIPDFEGKVVYAFVKGLSKGFDDGIMLEGCQLRTIGGRTFVVGRTVERIKPDWTAGAEASVAWDAVTTFLLYPSREAMVAACDRMNVESGGKSRGLISRLFGGGGSGAPT